MFSIIRHKRKKKRGVKGILPLFVKQKYKKKVVVTKTFYLAIRTGIPLL